MSHNQLANHLEMYQQQELVQGGGYVAGKLCAV